MRSRLNLHYVQYFTALPNADTLLFRIAVRFSGPNITYIDCTNLLDNADSQL